MSYILDALKKSDQQRKRDKVPDLNTVPIEPPPVEKKKKSWPFIVAGIVFLNVAFILFFILRQDKPETVQQAVMQNSDLEQATMVQEKQPAMKPQSLQIAPQALRKSPLEGPVASVAANNIASQDKNKALPVEQTATAASAAHEMNGTKTAKIPIAKENITVEHEETQSEPDLLLRGGNSQNTKSSAPVSNVTDRRDSKHELTKQVSHPAQQQAKEETEEETALGEPAAKDTAKNIASGMVQEAARTIYLQEDPGIDEEAESEETAFFPEEQGEGPERNLPKQGLAALPATSRPAAQNTRSPQKPLRLYELPASVQGQLPEIHIDAHVYYENKPASRMTSINGRLLREGDTLSPDLKVAEISSDGVIFSYQKYFFYLPVF